MQILRNNVIRVLGISEKYLKFSVYSCPNLRPFFLKSSFFLYLFKTVRDDSPPICQYLYTLTVSNKQLTVSTPGGADRGVELTVGLGLWSGWVGE